jgi:non-ribosomal peptide synthetase component F
MVAAAASATVLDDLSAQHWSHQSTALLDVSTVPSPVCFGELISRLDAGAAHLGAAGVGSESPVLDFVDEGVPMVLAILCILKSGGVCVPADPAAPSLRLLALLDDVDACVALCLGASMTSLRSRGWRYGPPSPQLLSIDAITGPAAPSPSPQLPQPTARCLCHLIYTSGSTGRPKAVAVEHGALRAYAQERIRAHGIEPRSRLLLTSAHTWDPCIGDVASALTAGATVCLAPRAEILHDLGRVLAAAEASHVGAHAGRSARVRARADHGLRRLRRAARRSPVRKGHRFAP